MIRFLGYSFAGFVFESILYGKFHFSKWTKGLPIPLKPVYGVGGLAAEAIGKRIQAQPLPVRFGVYMASLSALEWVACHISGRREWDYNGKCVDLPHALAWGGMGLLVERLK